MAGIANARVKIANLVDVLKTSGGLLVDAQIVETVPDETAQTPQISIDFSGVDAPLLLLNNGELLQAIQDVANAVLQLQADEYYLLWFDVNHFNTDRRTALQQLADDAVARVRETGRPFAFAPMRSSERRLLHLALSPSGLVSASIGQGFKRCVMLYPEGVAPPVEQPQPSAHSVSISQESTAA